MRADAKKNYGLLLEVARVAVIEHGAEASLRDIARRANVGLATLYRHFPTREALLEALLSADLDQLTHQAAKLEAVLAPGDALKTWFVDALAFTHTYNGVVAQMAAALEDVSSPLHASCSRVRAAGAQLLQRAQVAGSARTDIDGTDLFALMGGLAWIGEQPAFRNRTDHLSLVISDMIMACGKATRGQSVG